MSTIIGLDVSKKWLDVCMYQAGHKPVYERFTNNDQGHRSLIDYLALLSVNLIVCEPTGGYERAICQQLNANNLPIHQVNTYSFSAFSQSVNLSKTDKQDAFKLAYYADTIKLKANYSFQVTTERLKRQQQRREDLIAILSNEKKRLHHSQAGIDKESIEKVIKFLEEEIKTIDKDLQKTVAASTELQTKATILSSIPGIATCLATKLVSFLPELGNNSYSSNQLSAIVGIAPYAADSGGKKGKRFIRGGRKIPRDALYMAILAGKKSFGYIKKIYDRLVARYKPKKVAIVACMRKLLEIAHKLLQHKRFFVNQLETS